MARRLLCLRVNRAKPQATDETPSVDEPAAAEASTDAPQATSELAEIESLEEAYDNSLRAFSEGEIVKGTVINVDHDEVMVDIGFKSEGYIPVAEFPVMTTVHPP